MTSPRALHIAGHVTQVFPALEDPLEPVVAAAKSAVALAELDKHLAAHPDALTSGASTAPPSVLRLVAELQARGMAAVTPKCGSCHGAQAAALQGGRRAMVRHVLLEIHD